MTHTDFYRHYNDTDDLYALPVTAGGWTADGMVAGADTAQSGLYVFSGLDATDYEVFIRAGAAPAAVDQYVCTLQYIPPASIVVPDSPDFSGIVATGSQVTITVKQRDDYSASNNRAFAWTVVKPGINFNDAAVTIGAAGGRHIGYNRAEVSATMSLLNKANGSCTVQIEFTSEQLDVPAQTYAFDAHVLVDGHRVTTTEITLEVLEKYADAA